MCSVSMVSDHYKDRWPKTYPDLLPGQPLNPNTLPDLNSFNQNVRINNLQAQVDQLKAEVENMKELLIRAKIYDEENGEKDCEMAEKVALLKKIAELVGVDLSTII